MTALLKKLTLWRVITVFVIGAGLYGLFLRFYYGWQVSTNMSDAQPWGVWVGVGTLCGVGLSAGGFALAGAVYLLGMERYRPVLRASVLIAFLGYSTVCFGYLYELGLPWRMWYVLIYWNRASVLFEVAMCVMMYTTVLLLEFAPNVIEKLPWKRVSHFLLHYHHKIAVGLVLAGVLLSSMHQSFLGGLFLLTKGRMYPLWYSPYIHTMFFMTAIPAGLAMVIMVSYLSIRSLGAKIDYSILTDLSKVITSMLAMYAIFRAVNLINSDGVHYLFRRRIETFYFWIEVAFLVALPLVLYNVQKIRNNPVGLYWTSVGVVCGFIINRVNVSITSMEWTNHANYVPKWPEIAIMAATIAASVVVFRLCVQYLDVFPRVVGKQRWVAAPAEA